MSIHHTALRDCIYKGISYPELRKAVTQLAKAREEYDVTALMIQAVPENAPIEWRLSDSGMEALERWLATHISEYESYDKGSLLTEVAAEMIENFHDSGQLFCEDTSNGHSEFFMLPLACLEAVRVIGDKEGDWL